MDLADFRGMADPINEGLPFDPTHPVNGESLGTSWVVASYQSERYKSAELKARTSMMKASRTGKVRAEELDSKEVELLASLVVSWTGMTNRGVELPCTRENVMMVLSDPVIGPHLRAQLDEFAKDTERFFAASSKSYPASSSTDTGT